MHLEPRLVAIALSLALLAGPAFAEDPPPAPQTDIFVAICDAYGPGYRNIPGTDICLRVGGHVQLDVVGKFGKGPAGSGRDSSEPSR